MIQEIVITPDSPPTLSQSSQSYQASALAFIAKKAAKQNLHFGILKRKRIGWSFEFQSSPDAPISRQQAAKLVDLLNSITVDCVILIRESDWRKIKNTQHFAPRITRYQGDS